MNLTTGITPTKGCEDNVFVFFLSSKYYEAGILNLDEPYHVFQNIWKIGSLTTYISAFSRQLEKHSGVRLNGPYIENIVVLRVVQ